MGVEISEADGSMPLWTAASADLPPYSEWRYLWVDAMPAEKIDSGLGEIRPIAAAAEPHGAKD